MTTSRTHFYPFYPSAAALFLIAVGVLAPVALRPCAAAAEPNPSGPSLPTTLPIPLPISLSSLAPSDINATSTPTDSPAVTADSPLITDRPDVAEAPQTVGLLRFQIEMGISRLVKKFPTDARAGSGAL